MRQYSKGISEDQKANFALLEDLLRENTPLEYFKSLDTVIFDLHSLNSYLHEKERVLSFSPDYIHDITWRLQILKDMFLKMYELQNKK
jgi:hypothetical protein